MFSKFFMFCLTFLALNAANAQGLKTKLTDHSGNVEAVAYSPDGRYLASGGWDGKVNLYMMDSSGSPYLKQTFTGHLGAVISLSFSKNSKYLVSCSKDYSSRVWNIDTPARSKVFNLHLDPVTASFLDQSTKFLISASIDGTIRVTSVSDSRKSKVIKVSGPISDLLVSKDNKFYYVALKGGVIKKYETGGKNQEIASYVGHSDEINALELSPDGNFLASASNDKTIIIWDLASGKIKKKLEGFEWKVTSLEYSTDGKYIIGGCNNGVTKLFDVETGKSISDFNGMGKNVRDVAFSKNGKEIAIATHMDDVNFGAVIYNSGVSSAEAVPAGIKKLPAAKGTPAKTTTATPAKKPVTNGTK
jgi:WD40 repeat protein